MVCSTVNVQLQGLKVKNQFYYYPSKYLCDATVDSPSQISWPNFPTYISLVPYEIHASATSSSPIWSLDYSYTLLA